MSYVLTPTILATILQEQFPPNATCWSQATDEVRDMSRMARDRMGLGEEHAVDFRLCTTPAEWNTQGVTAIIQLYTLMDVDDKQAFINQFEHWLNGWTVVDPR